MKDIMEGFSVLCKGIKKPSSVGSKQTERRYFIVPAVQIIIAQQSSCNNRSVLIKIIVNLIDVLNKNILDIYTSNMKRTVRS